MSGGKKGEEAGGEGYIHLVQAKASLYLERRKPSAVFHKDHLSQDLCNNLAQVFVCAASATMHRHSTQWILRISSLCQILKEMAIWHEFFGPAFLT